MKLKNLKNEYLEFLVKKYHATQNDIFTWEDIKSLHPEFDDDLICKTLGELEDDGFVSVTWADNVAYITVLNTSAIIEAESNSNLVKAYKFLKEIRSWL